jgi:HEAT repeat protein
MRLSKSLLIIVTGCVFSLNPTHISDAQDYRRVDGLLAKLKRSVIKEELNSITLGPTLETQDEVREGLKKIAAESGEGRSEVIRSLVAILEDSAESKPDVSAPFGSALRWTAAVRLLGELRATEAIDALVSRLDQTGEFGIISSIHYRPVSTALTNIGEPAVPRLIETLSDRESEIRLYAASTLASIGQPAVAKLKNALRNHDAKLRGGAALALAWIGGNQVKASIENAIRRETDPDALNEMKYALKEIRGNRDN